MEVGLFPSLDLAHQCPNIRPADKEDFRATRKALAVGFHCSPGGLAGAAPFSWLLFC